MVDTSTSSSAVGQQTPFDSNTDFTMIAFMVRQIMALMDTMKPVQVVAVHPGAGSPPAAGTVDVNLLITLLDGAGNATPQGTVYGLPYFRLQGGPWAVICDPAQNDVGFLVCSDRDISALKSPIGSGAQPVNPGSRRKYNVADGIYMGGFFNAVPAATIWLKPDGTFSVTDKPGNVLQSSASGIAVTTASGGDFTVNGISVTQHTHAVAGIEAGEGDVESGPPVG